jgi:hypothetical protein
MLQIRGSTIIHAMSGFGTKPNIRTGSNHSTVSTHTTTDTKSHSVLVVSTYLVTCRCNNRACTASYVQFHSQTIDGSIISAISIFRFHIVSVVKSITYRKNQREKRSTGTNKTYTNFCRGRPNHNVRRTRKPTRQPHFISSSPSSNRSMELDIVVEFLLCYKLGLTVSTTMNFFPLENAITKYIVWQMLPIATAFPQKRDCVCWYLVRYIFLN